MKIFDGSVQRLLRFILLIFIFSTCQDNHSKKIRVATAANMRAAMEKLTKDFAFKSGVEFELIVGSSGKLTAQILEGAPYDIFVAANMKYPEAVFNGGKASSSPRVYANGQLVLWSMAENTPVTINDLSNSLIEHIALANPKTAPYGLAAVEVLTHYGLYETLAPKLVFGESIGQTDQFIVSKAAQIGFTALSSVLSPEMRGRGRWTLIDPSLYTNIDQGVVLVNRDGDNNPEAQIFYDFLFTQEAKEILKEFGYLMDE
ncbi:molybdate ABC transporter substrate-binding protein [Arenibacter sp. TNZ]|jgi:molybdate transport system substrate-binding protein|uniref:molybdate ABC transporter substrate-binding protein n=1 Tax=Arenibacter TaxID=178469 RepID=UPI000CD43571|nr:MULTISPECIES: molybdate ABC transporter substrate-binding protein [Arenibacter]MCM4174036.1 molybdate ABC transporter substrate-binding protein [Arenibacter sp. TNZ]